ATARAAPRRTETRQAALVLGGGVERRHQLNRGGTHRRPRCAGHQLAQVVGVVERDLGERRAFVATELQDEVAGAAQFLQTATPLWRWGGDGGAHVGGRAGLVVARGAARR